VFNSIIVKEGDCSSGSLRLDCCDCWFQSLPDARSLSHVIWMSCQVKVSVMCRSLVQSNPIECGVSNFVWLRNIALGCCVRKKKGKEDGGLEINMRFCVKGRGLTRSKNVRRRASVFTLSVIMPCRVSLFTAFFPHLQICHLYYLEFALSASALFTVSVRVKYNAWSRFWYSLGDALACGWRCPRVGRNGWGHVAALVVCVLVHHSLCTVSSWIHNTTRFFALSNDTWRVVLLRVLMNVEN
jgi:hypothetical protein